MMMSFASLAALLLISPAAALVVSPPLARRPTSLGVASHARTSSVTLIEEFLPSADVMNGVVSAAAESGGGGEIVDAAIFFLAVSVGVFFLTSTVEIEEVDGASASSNSKTAKKAGAKPTDGFGWLQADMRMPLPSWEELQQACHLVGDHNGHFMYLCASPQQDSTLETCEISEDFTQYYKNTVYLCAGAKVSSRRMSGGVHTGL